MRIALVGRFHEANTFSSVAADTATWKQQGILLGEEIRQANEGARSTIAGYLAWEEEDPEVEIVPLVFARITPTGTSTLQAFEYVVDQIIQALSENGPWDGVLLALHGAAVSEGFPDADGELARRVRQVVGQDVAIGMTLDMHANVSDHMAASTDVMTIYQTNPHVDTFEQGLACARLVGRTVRGQIRPSLAVVRLPLAINILRQGTEEQPMSGLLAAARAEQKRPGVLSTSLAEGFPYADVPWMGMSAVVIADGDEALAADVAQGLAVAMWDARHEMTGPPPTADEAIRLAAQEPQGPVVVLDMGDNVGGGSAGDSTLLLHAARAAGVSQVAMSLCDEVVVGLCQRAGVGGRIEGELGARTDDFHGEPFPFSGEVIALSDGKFEDLTPTHGNARYFDVGDTAGIRTDDGMLLAVHSRPTGTRSREQWRIAGIDPENVPILLAKGVHSPRAALEPIASRLIWADTAGVTSANIAALKYEHRSCPMYPFEPDAHWPRAGDEGDA